jgi:biopolymer transport protein ExbB/TolQ
MRLFALTLILVASLFLPACGDSHDDIIEERIDLFNEMADVLEDVEDEDDAEDAREKLKELMKEWDDITKRAEELGEPSKSEQKELKEEYEKDLEKAMSRFTRQLTGVMTTSYGQKELSEIMKDLGKLR